MKKTKTKKTTAPKTKETTIEVPTWIKIEDFVYEIKGTNGGLCRAIAKTEKTQDELFNHWRFAYLFLGRKKPEKGELHILVCP